MAALSLQKVQLFKRLVFLVAILSLISYVTPLHDSVPSRGTRGNQSDCPDEVSGVEFYSHFTDEETETGER